MGPDPVGRICALSERLGPRLLVQIREKDLSARDLHAWVCALLPALAARGSVLLVSGRLDLALGFAPKLGVHLPEDGLPVAEVRRALPAGARVSAAAHSVAGALERAHAGADLITLSPIFPTSSKPGAPGLGLAPLREAARALAGRAELFALGGVDASRVGEVLATGVAGVAAIGAAWDAEPERLVSESDH